MEPVTGARLLLLAALAASGLPARAQPSPGDRAFGAYLAGECVACHLPSGRQVGGIPAITGIPEDRFAAEMQRFRRRERENAVMQVLAARLSDAEIAALAAYFGSLPAPGN